MFVKNAASRDANVGEGIFERIQKLLVQPGREIQADDEADRLSAHFREPTRASKEPAGLLGYPYIASFEL